MIVMIDDEARRMGPYLEVLEYDMPQRRVWNCANYTLEEINELALGDTDILYLNQIDEARDWVLTHLNVIELLVVDIMMPQLDSYSSQDTDHGLRTGIAFYREIRGQDADNAKVLPIMFLTNVYDPEVSDSIQEDTYTVVYQKNDLIPSRMASTIQEFLGS